jgi:hypothetical protein
MRLSYGRRTDWSTHEEAPSIGDGSASHEKPISVGEL